MARAARGLARRGRLAARAAPCADRGADCARDVFHVGRAAVRRLASRSRWRSSPCSRSCSPGSRRGSGPRSPAFACSLPAATATRCRRSLRATRRSTRRRARRSSCRSATRTCRACSPACAPPTIARTRRRARALRFLRALRHHRRRHPRCRDARRGRTCAAPLGAVRARVLPLAPAIASSARPATSPTSAGAGAATTATWSCSTPTA